MMMDKGKLEYILVASLIIVSDALMVQINGFLTMYSIHVVQFNAEKLHLTMKKTLISDYLFFIQFFTDAIVGFVLHPKMTNQKLSGPIPVVAVVLDIGCISFAFSDG